MVLSFFCPALKAQITVDGNPADWANFTSVYPTNAYSHDANNSNDNQFTQGSKDGMDLSGWHWSDGSTNNKGDITNAAAVLTFENGSYYLAFAGDRAVNNGDAAIGFWFFKNNVSLNSNGTFSGVHANGDLLVVSHFTQGGGQADIFIYIWNNGALLDPVTSSTAAVNSGTPNVPAGFTYASATYPVGDFFEGKINLTALNISPCFNNFLLETRNSQSITASLQDLTFGSFTQSVAVTANATPAGPVSIASATPHYQLSTTVDGILNNSNYTYSWVQNPVSGGTLSTTTIPNPTFTATTAGTYTWTVTATGIVGGCTNSASVTRVIAGAAGCPVISSLAVCAGGTGTITATTGELNNAIPANTHYDWSITGAANGASITSATHDVTSITVHAGTGNFTVKVRVTYDNPNLPAIETCTKQVTVNPGPGPLSLTIVQPTLCNSVTSASVTVCNPGAGTYTLTQTGQTAKVINYTSGALTFTNLALGAGGFTITYVDGNGCTGSPSNCSNIVSSCPSQSLVAKASPSDVRIVVPEEEPKVLVAPNPFSDRLRFSVQSAVSGQGVLELYNMLGQKVKTVYQGYFEKGATRSIEYSVPGSQRANLIYLFRIGSQKVSGKLIGLK